MRVVARGSRGHVRPTGRQGGAVCEAMRAAWPPCAPAPAARCRTMKALRRRLLPSTGWSRSCWRTLPQTWAAPSGSASWQVCAGEAHMCTRRPLACRLPQCSSQPSGPGLTAAALPAAPAPRPAPAPCVRTPAAAAVRQRRTRQSRSCLRRPAQTLPAASGSGSWRACASACMLPLLLPPLLHVWGRRRGRSCLPAGPTASVRKGCIPPHPAAQGGQGRVSERRLCERSVVAGGARRHALLVCSSRAQRRSRHGRHQGATSSPPSVQRPESALPCLTHEEQWAAASGASCAGGPAATSERAGGEREQQASREATVYRAGSGAAAQRA